MKVEVLDRWTAERVWEKCLKLRLNDREALLFLKISPSNYDILTERSSPQMERQFLLSTVRMLLYYTPLQLQEWLYQAVFLSSLVQYDFDQDFPKIIKANAPAKTFYGDNSDELAQINANLKISDVAKHYGLILKKNRCVCPFHKGTNDTELLFNDDKNAFKCFSCGEHGLILNFIRRMEDLKNG